jgi:hypothetical protein
MKYEIHHERQTEISKNVFPVHLKAQFKPVIPEQLTNTL